MPEEERACRAGSLSVAQDLCVVNDQFNRASDVRAFFLRRDDRCLGRSRACRCLISD